MANSESANHLLVIGAGGHASVVIDVARAAGFEPVAALDPANIGSTCNGVDVIGSDEMAQSLFAKDLRLCVVGIGDNRQRWKLGERLRAIGFKLPPLCHPSAILSPSARIGDGTVVMPLAVVNASATIGTMVIVNTAAVIEHDCEIGNGAHIAPGSRLGGTVSVGQCTLIGIGSVVRPAARIGDFAVIGAGSTVIGDIEEHKVATGCPARVRRSA
jgi:UDP-perosamine 4-acetyltransferase